MSSGSLFHADGPVGLQCEKRRARRTWCEVVVARSRSMRMIVGEDAVCWDSLSGRLELCLADFSVIDHSVEVSSALKMKLTLKIRRYF